jgi:uncharacterized protein YkwD
MESVLSFLLCLILLSSCDSPNTASISSSNLPGQTSTPGSGTTGGTTGVPTGGTTTPPTLDAESAAFLVLLNNLRAQNGLAALTLSPLLIESSQWMSTDMATNNYFDHTDSLGRDPFTRMTAFGYDSNDEGENIAAGNSDAQSTYTQWVNSAPHLANMLDSSYTQIGVGRAYSADSTYGWYWTTDFGSN